MTPGWGVIPQPSRDFPLAAPENARKTFSLLIERIDAWIAAMQAIVDSAGNLVQSFIHSRAAAPEEESQANTAAPEADASANPGVPAERPAEEKNSGR